MGVKGKREEYEGEKKGRNEGGIPCYRKERSARATSFMKRGNCSGENDAENPGLDHSHKGKESRVLQKRKGLTGKCCLDFTGTEENLSWSKQARGRGRGKPLFFFHTATSTMPETDVMHLLLEATEGGKKAWTTNHAHRTSVTKTPPGAKKAQSGHTLMTKEHSEMDEMHVAMSYPEKTRFQ